MIEAEELRLREYDARLRVARLRQEAYGPDAEGDLDELARAEHDLSVLAAQSAAARTKDAVVLDTRDSSGLLGAASTGLEATARVRMSHVPTAFCHLLDVRESPLVTMSVHRTNERETRRLRVSCTVEGYSAAAIDTVELDSGRTRSIDLLPTFYPSALAAVTELTRATVSVRVEDLDTRLTEVERTTPIWLLARDTAPTQTLDPSTGAVVDLTRYLGAFVTPHTREVIAFTRQVVERHPDRMLLGYQGSAEAVEGQVRAVYETLAADQRMAYVNSVISYNPEEGAAGQRVRLPRESLEHGLMNCLDGTVLFASVLENLSLQPEIVLVPGHALVGWLSWPDTGSWAHLDTTVMGPDRYESARKRGDQVVARYSAGDGALVRRWPIRRLRGMGITPME
ncbi:hypothetical protein P3T36_000980 [Kitasatospora sp. MAP12-15]|uniref:hypothetical protein n=1 Tax=unclassified Kitasatospora TaxID=2633591 RepID=UPI0024760399|nr:hypothetical protein [Kitasatospora sp. MAP12-44]MDH6114581.1 hypothetical protein [Kitasatospora sp. MAP12-44]